MGDEIQMIRRVGALGAVCVLVLGLAAACSSGGSSSNGNKAEFCKTNAELGAATTNLSSADDFLNALKSNQSKFDAYVKNAPSEVKADAQKLVDAAKKAISSNNASSFESDSSLASAAAHVDSFCGQSSSSSTSSSSSSSSSSRSTSSSSATGSGSAADI